MGTQSFRPIGGAAVPRSRVTVARCHTTNRPAAGRLERALQLPSTTHRRWRTATRLPTPASPTSWPHTASRSSTRPGVIDRHDDDRRGQRKLHCSLLRGQLPFRVDLLVKPIHSRLARRRGAGSPVLGVRPRHMRGDLRAQPTLLRCQLIRNHASSTAQRCHPAPTVTLTPRQLRPSRGRAVRGPNAPNRTPAQHMVHQRSPPNRGTPSDAIPEPHAAEELLHRLGLWIVPRQQRPIPLLHIRPPHRRRGPR